MFSTRAKRINQTEIFEGTVLDLMDLLTKHIYAAVYLLQRNQRPDHKKRCKKIENLAMYFIRLGKEVTEYLEFQLKENPDSFEELFVKYAMQLKHLVFLIIQIAESPTLPDFVGSKPIAVINEKFDELDEMVRIASECFAGSEHYEKLCNRYKELKLNFWRNYYNNPDGENLSDWFDEVHVLLKLLVDQMFSIDKPPQESIKDRLNVIKEKYESNFERIGQKFADITVPKEHENEVLCIKNLLQSTMSAYAFVIEEKLSYAGNYKSLCLVDRIIEEATSVLTKYVNEIQTKVNGTGKNDEEVNTIKIEEGAQERCN